MVKHSIKPQQFFMVKPIIKMEKKPNVYIAIVPHMDECKGRGPRSKGILSIIFGKHSECLEHSSTKQ
jgi:hypothetical protein